MTEQKKIALQLFSLRDDSKKDFINVLEKVAEMGYEGVEFAGYGGLKCEEIAKVLQDLNLKVAGSHVGYNLLEKELEQVIEYSLGIGSKDITCPGVPHDKVKDAKGWLEFAEFMNKVAEKCQAHGIRVSYHNHSYEFAKIDGKYALDIFFEAVDPKKVYTQLDLGWVLNAGIDPVNYLKKYKGRCPLVHIKDFDGKKQIEVGKGDLDLAGIVNIADEIGIEWLIIETEEYNMSPMDSVKVGLDNLRKHVK